MRAQNKTLHHTQCDSNMYIEFKVQVKCHFNSINTVKSVTIVIIIILILYKVGGKAMEEFIRRPINCNRLNYTGVY